MQTQINKISFKGQNIYVGIDVHLKNWKVTVLTENSLARTFSQDPSPKNLYSFLSREFPDGNYLSAYESGFSGYKAHRQLKDLGIDNIIVNPADIPTTDKERKQKEDRRDSKKIAKSLKGGILTGIYIPSEEIIELRSLIRYRKTLVKEISRHKTRIKSFLYFHGVDLPVDYFSSPHWSARFSTWVKSIETKTTWGSSVLGSTMSNVEHMRKELLSINQMLRSINKESQYSSILNLLQSVPGIGLIASFTFLSELEDIKRFKSVDRLCSFVGLIPRTNSSGENDKVGSITTRSNKPLRSIIIEAAWVASRIDPVLSQSYVEFSRRMKPTEAIVKIAKKLLTRIRYVLKNNTEYVCSVVQ